MEKSLDVNIEKETKIIKLTIRCSRRDEIEKLIVQALPLSVFLGDRGTVNNT